MLRPGGAVAGAVGWRHRGWGHRGWAAGEGGNRVVSPPHPTIQGHTESLRMTPSLEQALCNVTGEGSGLHRNLNPVDCYPYKRRAHRDSGSQPHDGQRWQHCCHKPQSTMGHQAGGSKTGPSSRVFRDGTANSLSWTSGLLTVRINSVVLS